MIEFLAEYGLFLLKVITVVAGMVVVIVVAASAGRKATQEGLEVESLNKKHEALAETLRSAVSSKEQQKKAAKEKKKKDKADAKDEATRPRSFVIDFKGDLKASAVPSLREEVSAILDVATAEDEVIVRLENLAQRTQLQSLRDKVEKTAPVAKPKRKKNKKYTAPSDLSTAQLRKARRLKDDEWSCVEIADEIGCAPGSVHHVVALAKRRRIK